MAFRFNPAILAPAPDGSVGVVSPDLPGCVSGGANVRAASLHAVEAPGLHIAGMPVGGDAILEPSALGAVPDLLAEDAGTVLGYWPVRV